MPSIERTGPLDEASAVAPAAAEEAAAASGPAPQNGWLRGDAPNGRVLGFDLARMDEDELLRGSGRAALYALGDGPQDFHPGREPLVLIHGINGDPKDLQAVVERFKDRDRYQLYVVAYDDLHRRTSFNGDDLAQELRSLLGRTGPGHDLSIVAHSMGGIVARRALNTLADGNEAVLERYGRVRLVAADTGWHGYSGPSDGGFGGFLMGIARPFMPDGLEDMRAGSRMFTGDPDARRPAERAGLLSAPPPQNVSVDLVFASSGDQVNDWTEGDLRELPQEIVDLYTRGSRVRGSDQLDNFWKALRGASCFPALERELLDLAARGALDADAVRGALTWYFPRFPGGHAEMLRERPGGQGFLDYLSRTLG